jgi:hypothetical protein
MLELKLTEKNPSEVASCPDHQLSALFRAITYKMAPAAPEF